MGSRKSQLIKIRLRKAFRQNKTFPAWKRRIPEHKQGVSRSRRNWRQGKLKIY